MRRIFWLFGLLFSATLICMAAVVVILIVDPFNNEETSTTSTGNTTTPVTVDITSTDGCEFTASSAQSAGSRRNGRPQTLPNGRPFPNVEPRAVNIPNRPVPDQVMIQFTDSSTQQERNNYIQSIGGRSRRNIDRLNTFVVTLPAGTDTAALPESDIVTLIEPDYVAGANQGGQNGTNDPRYGEQWALPVVGMPDPWSALGTGVQPITIAVIDSGICAGHPDLAGRVVAGYDFVEDDNDPQDTFGHGCGVAGVIAANLNNSTGIAGVAPNTRIMGLRVLDATGTGSYSDISAALIYAADNGAQIINLSLGATFYSQVMADAVNYAAQRGVTIIAAAGNYGQDGALYPAALPGVVSVGAIDPDLQRSSFSNYGTTVDLYAPGRDILTTNISGDYEMMTGTSFAAPYVAGIAAMARAFGQPLNTENNIVYLYTPESQPVCSG